MLPKSITPVITIHCYFYNPILFLINNCYLSYNRLVILSNRTIVICCLNIGTYLIYNIHTICYITKTGIITIKVCTVFMNYKALSLLLERAIEIAPLVCERLFSIPLLLNSPFILLSEPPVPLPSGSPPCIIKPLIIL